MYPYGTIVGKIVEDQVKHEMKVNMKCYRTLYGLQNCPEDELNDTGMSDNENVKSFHICTDTEEESGIFGSLSDISTITDSSKEGQDKSNKILENEMEILRDKVICLEMENANLADKEIKNLKEIKVLKDRVCIVTKPEQTKSEEIIILGKLEIQIKKTCRNLNEELECMKDKLKIATTENAVFQVQLQEGVKAVTKIIEELLADFTKQLQSIAFEIPKDTSQQKQYELEQWEIDYKSIEHKLTDEERIEALNTLPREENRIHFIEKYLTCRK